MSNLVAVKPCNNIMAMHRPGGTFLKRDVRLLRKIIAGVHYLDVGAEAGISLSQSRSVVQELAMKLFKLARLDDPTIPMQYKFSVTDFTEHAGVWHDRIEKYIPVLEKQYANS